PAFEETARLAKAKLGDDHPSTLTSMNNLASVYHATGQIEKALPLYEATLPLMKAKLGADHPLTITLMNNLASAYSAAGQLDKAVPISNATLQLANAKLGADHPLTLSSMNTLASAYLAAGQVDKALPLYEQAARGLEQRRFQHEHAGQILPGFISALERTDDWSEAETWRRKWLTALESKVGPESLQYASELAGLGQNLMRQAKWLEAEAVLRECLAIREQAQADAWTVFQLRSLLGGALLGQKKYDEAETLLRAGHDGMKRREQT